MAAHSSTLAWKIPWMKEPGRLLSMGSRRVELLTECFHFHFSLSCIGEGNGNPLQCSCLENPRDGGAWWAAVYGVAQSRTRLKRLAAAAAAARLPGQTSIVPGLQASFQGETAAVPPFSACWSIFEKVQTLLRGSAAENVENVTESKLSLLPIHRPVNQRKCWGKEYNFYCESQQI